MRLFTKTCARHLLISSFALGLTLLPGLNTTTNVSGQRRHIAPRGNPDIPKIIAEISSRRIEPDIRKLVSFGTRNTLSEQNNPNRGIGAARDWLYAEFQKAAAASGGRMTVEKQAFEQARAARVPQPTIVTNVGATLKGTQAESTNRVYVVSGHYDWMCGSAANATC